MTGRKGRFAGACLLALLALTSATGRCDDTPTPARCGILAGGYYVRKIKDQEWHVRLVGRVPSLCGAYLLIFDATGKIIHQGLVPHGEYPEAKPFTVAVKPDGLTASVRAKDSSVLIARTGDYRIMMFGRDEDMLSVLVPWTDLPYEAYGGGLLSAGHNPAARIWFKAPEGVTKMSLGAHGGNLQVLGPDGKVAADSKATGKKVKTENVLEFGVTPGATYELKRETFYFASNIPDTFYVATDPARWFKPSAELANLKWWRNVNAECRMNDKDQSGGE